MGRSRFTCAYCNKSFEDSPDARRRHNGGRAHKTNVKLWYDSFQDQAQRSSAGNASAEGNGLRSEWVAVAAPAGPGPAPAPPSAAGIDLQQLPPSMIPPPPELFLHYRADWG